MKIIPLKYIVLLLLGILSSGNTIAQSLWKQSHTEFDGSYYYMFNAISSYGNICIAAGSVVDENNQKITLTLWRSEDGGKSWVTQDPGLPPYTSLDRKHYFTDVQQIDSLNAIAIGVTWLDTLIYKQLGDSGVIVRTYDGGITWHRQANLVNGILRKVHFSDSLHGIVLAQENNIPAVGEGNVRIHTTTDGGHNWTISSFVSGNRVLDCYSYGQGEFRVAKIGKGIIYHTSNNWSTVDSTDPVFTSINDPDNKYYMLGCVFANDGTILGYGNYDSNGDFGSDHGFIVRSSDFGKTWADPYLTTDEFKYVGEISSLNRDTVFAGGYSLNKILVSTDKGISWRADTMLVDSGFSVHSTCLGLTMLSDGLPLAIFTEYGDNTPSRIFRSIKTPSSVRHLEMSSEQISFYPNPAINELNILTVKESSIIEIIDILGRTVKTVKADGSDKLKINISSLPRGVYSIRSNNGRSSKVEGKVVLQ